MLGTGIKTLRQMFFKYGTNFVWQSHGTEKGQVREVELVTSNCAFRVHPERGQRLDR